VFGQGTDGYVIDASSSYCLKILGVFDTTRSLESDIRVIAEVVSCSQIVDAEVVYHDPVGFRGDGFTEFIQVFNFHLYSGIGVNSRARLMAEAIEPAAWI